MSRLPALAVRNVGRNRRRSAITILAIFVCVMMVMALRGTIDGAAVLMASDAIEGRSGAIQIHKKGFVDNIEAVPTSINLPYTPELLAKIRAVPGVKAVTARIMFDGLVSNGKTQTLFIGRGVDVAHEAEVCPRADTLVNTGAPLKPGETNAAVLGFELAESFGLKVGETLTLQTTSPGGRANAMDLKAQGTTSSTLPFENKRVVTVPLATAQDLLGLKGRVTEYAVAVDKLEQVNDIRDRLQAALGPEFEVHTWEQLQVFVRDVIARQRMVMGLIAGVLWVIAFTVIANTMLMSVFERVREIGTLLAVGLRRRQVLTLFMLEATTLGFFGASLGAVVGRALLWVVASIGVPIDMPGTSGHSMLRPTVTLTFVGLVMVAAVVGAVLASAIPALRASKLNPVDALRAN